MMWNRKLEALFIDFDGTLIDSLPRLKEIYHFFLKAEGFEGSEEEFEYLNGRSLKEIVHYLKVKYDIQRTENEVQRLYFALIESLYMNDIKLFPGARTFFQKAAERNVPIWIVTSTNEALARKKIEKEELFVRGIISGEQLDHGKPDPAIYLKALKEAKVSPFEVVAIEDAENGVAAAKAAGVEVFHFGTYDWATLKMVLWG